MSFSKVNKDTSAFNTNSVSTTDTQQIEKRKSGRFGLDFNSKLSALQSKVKNFLGIIKENNSIAQYQNISEKGRLFANFAGKKDIFVGKKILPHSKEMIEKYQGLDSNVHVKASLDDINKLLQDNELTPAERSSLLEIKKNRELMLEIQGTKLKKRGKLIASCVNELNNPSSEKPIKLQNGGRSIVIPMITNENGGGHFITCEVKRENREGKERTFLCIHNRGVGCTHPLHGNLNIKDEKGYEYRETSMEIEINDPNVLDEEFFSELTACEEGGGFEAPYELIQKRIIDSGKGKKTELPNVREIVKNLDDSTPAYTKFFTLHANGPEIENLKFDNSEEDNANIQTLIKNLESPDNNDLVAKYPKLGAKLKNLKKALQTGNESSIKSRAKELNAFIETEIYPKLLIEKGLVHSLQKYGTCSYSNMTQPEKGMADPITVRKLKRFGIQRRIADVMNDSTISERDKTRMQNIAGAREKKLTGEIEKLNQNKVNRQGSQMSEQMALHNGRPPSYDNVMARKLQEQVKTNENFHHQLPGKLNVSRGLVNDLKTLQDQRIESEKYMEELKQNQSKFTSGIEEEKAEAIKWFNKNGTKKATHETTLNEHMAQRGKKRGELQKELREMAEGLERTNGDPALIAQIRYVRGQIALVNTPTAEVLRLTNDLFTRLDDVAKNTSNVKPPEVDIPPSLRPELL